MGIEARQFVTPEPKSVVGLKNSRFPERVGRIRIPTADEIAEITDPASGQPKKDRVVLFSVMSMDWGS